MNAYQKYIDSLVTEYGPLLSRQLCALVNKEFETALPNIDGYANQLCQFADFDDSLIENETAIGKKGEDANVDMIRAVDVMLEFGNDVEYFKKGCYPAVLWFLVNTKEHTKEICVVAVHEGEDINTLTQFEEDDEDNIKCSMTIFLLENKKQMSKFTKMKNMSRKFFELSKEQWRFGISDYDDTVKDIWKRFTTEDVFKESILSQNFNGR